MGVPQIIHFNRSFQLLGHPHLWKPPTGRLKMVKVTPHLPIPTQFRFVQASRPCRSSSTRGSSMRESIDSGVETWWMDVVHQFQMLS
jgi:hypothetical protein